MQLQTPIVKSVVFILFFLQVSSADSPSVIIVGAGPSGIAAAAKLFENGITNITILEAENRYGGRIYSTEFEGATVDLGGEFCHGIKDNIVYELASPYGLLEEIHASYNFYYSSKEKDADSEFFKNLFHLFSKIHEEGEETVTDNISVGDFLTEKCNAVIAEKFGNDTQKAKYARDFLASFLHFVTLYDSPLSIYDLSLPNYYQRCEGNQFIAWKNGGYRTILNILMKKYPNPSEQLPIEEMMLLNKEVTKISWEKGDEDSKNVLVECSDKSSYSADYVIFTPSLGVLKHDHKKIFSPSLPANKVNAIEKLGFGAISKIFMHFPERWWPHERFTSFVFVWSEEDKELILKEFPYGPNEDGKSWLLNAAGAFGIIKEDPNVLVSWVGGQFVPQIEKLSDELVMNGYEYILKKFLGDKYNVTRPDKILRNNWYSNPHFRGTYSYESVESRKEGTHLQKILAEPVTSSRGEKVLLFAGEATHPIHYSTVHSAIETGHREAQRILKMVKKN